MEENVLAWAFRESVMVARFFFKGRQADNAPARIALSGKPSCVKQPQNAAKTHGFAVRTPESGSP